MNNLALMTARTRAFATLHPDKRVLVLVARNADVGGAKARFADLPNVTVRVAGDGGSTLRINLLRSAS